MPDNYDKKRRADVSALPRLVPVVVVPGSLPYTLPATAKACEVDADGTMTVCNEDDSNPTVYPVKANTPLPFIPPRITAITGATKIFVF